MFKPLLFICLGLVTIQSVSTAQCNAHHKTRVAASYHHKDIVDIAAGNDNFSTLVVAVKTAGLVETLKSDGPFTVFAPSNAAFSKLPEGTVAGLLKPSAKNDLSKILTYHVIAGEYKASDVINAANAAGGSFSVATVQGGELTITVNNGSVILTDEKGNRSAVTTTDLTASNGVIHAIDTVVLPK